MGSGEQGAGEQGKWRAEIKKLTAKKQF